MKVLLTIWISAVLIQEVVPSTLVRYPRNAKNMSSFLHTEYEAKIEQKGKHGNESFGTMSGKQAIEHDNCNDNWNAFANKCAMLIKDLVASLANSVSSKPGDATNLQLHIKNTFRHLDNTHNCSCLNHTVKDLSDVDLFHIFDNLTSGDSGPANYDKGPSSTLRENKHPKKLTSDANVNPENEEDPNSTSNSRRQAKHEPHPSSTPKSNDVTGASSVAHPQNPHGHKSVLHAFLTTPLPSSESYTSDSTSTIPPLHYTNKHSPPESSSIKKSSTPHYSDGTENSSTLGNSYKPESDTTSETPPETEPPLAMTPGKHQKPMKKTDHTTTPNTFASQTPVPAENSCSQSSKSEDSTTPKPDYDYDELVSGSTGQTTKARPKHDYHSSSTTDPNSYETPIYDYPTEAPNPSTITAVTNTNTNSNIPESSEPTTSHDSLSSGASQTPSDENSPTEDILSHSTGSTPDSEHVTTACDETSVAETVTVPSTSPSESPFAHETEDEVLITPRPIKDSQTPAAENQKFTPQRPQEESEITDSTSKHETSTSASPADEVRSTNPQSVYSTSEQGATEAPCSSEKPTKYGTTAITTEKDDDEIKLSTAGTVPEKSSAKTDHEGKENETEEHTTVTMLPTRESTTGGIEEKNRDHTEVSENPVLVQPTTFQTTSEDPTRSPFSTQSSPKIMPVTVASTPQDSDEATTSESKHSESKHEKHHHHNHHHHNHHRHHDDDDDDEDDCCSCESCTEEEELDPRKMKEKVCKSLEEARKELKEIFEKINKKLRCCRKMPQRITTNTSPLPQ